MSWSPKKQVFYFPEERPNVESTTTGQEYTEEKHDDVKPSDSNQQEEMISILVKIFPEKDKVNSL